MRATKICQKGRSLIRIFISLTVSPELGQGFRTNSSSTCARIKKKGNFFLRFLQQCTRLFHNPKLYFAQQGLADLHESFLYSSKRLELTKRSILLHNLGLTSKLVNFCHRSKKEMLLRYTKGRQDKLFTAQAHMLCISYVSNFQFWIEHKNGEIQTKGIYFL